MLKPDWISSSSVTSEDFVCTQVRPVFPPCALSSLRRASFQADRHESEHLALSRRKDAVLLISSHQQTEAQSANPQIQKKKLLEALGKIKVTTGANAAQTWCLARFHRGHRGDLWGGDTALTSSATLDSSDKLINYTPLSCC